jgi:hypothetical protein
MKILLELCKHGTPELWNRLCPFATSKEVLSELAGPITSEPGTLWVFATDSETGDVVGFTSLCVRKGIAWRDYAYVIKAHRKQGVFSKLAEHWTKIAVGYPVRMLIREVRWKHYESRGYQKITQRSSWCVIGKEAA